MGSFPHERPHHHRDEKKRDTAFVLPPAVQIGSSNTIVPVDGYRLKMWREEDGLSRCYLMASVTHRKLIEAFFALVATVDDQVVDVCLESHHANSCGNSDDAPREFWRDDIEPTVLRSYLSMFEDFLLRDGQTGICVVGKSEVQLTRDKLLLIFGGSHRPAFEAVLQSQGIPNIPNMRFFNEGECHRLRPPRAEKQFQEMVHILGAEEEPQNTGQADDEYWKNQN